MSSPYYLPGYIPNTYSQPTATGPSFGMPTAYPSPSYAPNTYAYYSQPMTTGQPYGPPAMGAPSFSYAPSFTQNTYYAPYTPVVTGQPASIPWTGTNTGTTVPTGNPSPIDYSQLFGVPGTTTNPANTNVLASYSPTAFSTVSGDTALMMKQVNLMMSNVMAGVATTLMGLASGAMNGSTQQPPSTDGGTTGGTSFTGTVNKGDAAAAIKFFESKEGGSWTHAQAVGIVANLIQESNISPTSVGDGGQAYGVAQWHPGRQGNFAKYAKEKGLSHTNIRSATLTEQLGFVNWELNNTEKSAGAKLRQAQTPYDAAASVSRYYERPANTEGEMAKRGNKADQIA